MAGSVVVAIPVHDEEERVGACLLGLAQQVGVAPFTVALLLNNCRDTTGERVASLARSMPFRLIAVRERLPPALAHAGEARRRAVGLAARLGGSVLVTSDADAVAPPTWLARNLSAIANGAEVVAGRAVIDPEDAAQLPTRLHAEEQKVAAYAALLDEIASLVDPDPNDPWPRHDQQSGASIAVTVAAWRRAGGIPSRANGEDRAFFAALRRTDARIRHDPDIWVTVSGRLEGRAAGGMAATIRRRIDAPDLWLDDRLERVTVAARRSRLRAWLRRVTPNAPDIAAYAEASGLAPIQLRRLLRHTGFGRRWAAIEAASPTLARARVPTAALAAETDVARRLRDSLSAPAADRGDSVADAAS